MRQVKKSLVLIVFFVVTALLLQPAIAEEVSSEREYKPLDLVLVIDGSGSMLSSDPDRTAIAAGRMLTNMMPATDSRVAIVSFNTKPTTHTLDSSGNEALIGLERFANVELIRDALVEIKYEGDTGIGNALLSAVELLESKSSEDHQQAIILFTDGVNDFGANTLGLVQCEENEATALQKAKKNEYVVYCVGYDYPLESGGTSMGTNGEGLTKLENIAKTTGGKFKEINDISEMEQLLIEFMADVLDVIYKPGEMIPGDGGTHTVPLIVSPSVEEFNVRLAGGGKDAISAGKVRLFEPEGNEIELKNSDDVRYDVDATAACIKVIKPKAGEWQLMVNGITGDDIHVGMLEHFKTNIASKIIFPKGNPASVAYANDKLTLETWLTKDGKPFEDDDVYNAITSATATFVSRADPNNRDVVELKRDGYVYKGDFTIPADSFYDVKVRIEWDAFYREDTLTVMSSNRPLELVSNIDDVELDNGKTATISNIYQHVFDDENDAITAEVSSVGDPTVVDAVVDGDDIVVSGHKWSSTLVTVTFTDKQGNTVESTFVAKVNDPVAMALIVAGIVAIILLILALLYFIWKKTFRIFGTVRVSLIQDVTYADGKIASIDTIYKGGYASEGDIEAGIGWGTAFSRGDEDAVDGWRSSDVWMQDAGNGDDGWGFDITKTEFGGDAIDQHSHEDIEATIEDWTSGWDISTVEEANGDADSGTSWSVGWEEKNKDNVADVSYSDYGDMAWSTEQKKSQPKQKRPSKEEVEDLELYKTFDGVWMQIDRAITKKEPNLYAVLNRFVEVFLVHMTPGHRRSPMAEQISEYVISRLGGFREFKVTGTPFGRKGIVVHVPKSSNVAVVDSIESGDSMKGNIKLDHCVTLKFVVRSAGSDSGAYVEMDYRPRK